MSPPSYLSKTKKHKASSGDTHVPHREAKTIVPQSARLLLYADVPSWQQENKYLCSGYRPSSPSIYDSLASLTQLHNQTVNIYTHLVGALAFAFLPAYFYRQHFCAESDAPIADLIVVSIYCVGVTICFSLSAMFHIFLNHSPSFTGLCNRLDYVGILLLMWSASIPTIHYGFYCATKLRNFHWILTTCMASACGILTLQPRFSASRTRRLSLFVGFALSSAGFMIHGLTINGWEFAGPRMSLDCMKWMAAANFLGAGMYITRMPERWSPGRFDTCGASHQMFHIFVLIAACTHFYGLTRAFHVAQSELSCLYA